MYIQDQILAIDERMFTGKWFVRDGELFLEVGIYPVYGSLSVLVPVKKRTWYTLWIAPITVMERRYGKRTIQGYEGSAFISEHNLVDI